jgi:hypothetical protein
MLQLMTLRLILTGPIVPNGMSAVFEKSGG